MINEIAPPDGRTHEQHPTFLSLPQIRLQHAGPLLPSSGSFRARSGMAILRQRISAKVEALVALLDLIDGDPDFEVVDEDRCEALDDVGSAFCSTGLLSPWAIAAGDADDAEDDLADLDDFSGTLRPGRGIADRFHGSFGRFVAEARS